MLQLGVKMGGTMLEGVTMLQLGVHLDLKEQCSHRYNNVANAGEKDRCKAFFVINF